MNRLMLTIYKSKIHEIFYLLAILVCALFGMKALLHPGLFTAHDIYNQVTRIYYYYSSVNDGQFPPFWITQLASNHGYPLFFFSYHLPWLLSLPILSLGASITDTLKILFFLGFISSGISMYYFSVTILKDKISALASSILFMWAPYHFLTIFVSASIGVVYAFVFLPIISLGIYLCFKKRLAGILILAISTTGLILSHLLHIVFFLPTLAIFFIWSISVNNFNLKYLFNITAKYIIPGLILAILLSAFYLLPAYYYQKLTYFKNESGFSSLYKRSFINFSQLIYSKWNFGPIINNAKSGEISFQLGLSQWISITILLFMFLTNKIRSNLKTLASAVLTSFFINTFLLLDYSLPFWQFFEKVITIDYPFRFILPLVFLTAFSAGIIMVSLNKNLKTLFFFFMLIITFYTNRNHLNVNLYTDTPIKDYLNSVITVTTNTFHEYSPLGADRRLINKSDDSFTDPIIPISNLKQTTIQISFNTMIENETNISIKQFNFPGLNTYIDNTLTLVNTDKKGLININIPKGNHNIKIKFEETILMRKSMFLTLSGIILSFVIFVKILVSRGK